MSEGLGRSGVRKTRFSEVWNLPNMLTYGRILAVPVVAALLLWDDGTAPWLWNGNAARWLALAVFVAAAITDFFDGYLARKWQQQSSLGRMLDPIADKVLVAVVLLVLAAVGSLNEWWAIWAAIIIMAREVLVSGLREFLGEVQVSVPVTRIAKYKTTVQMIAIGFLIAGPAGDRIFPFVSKIGVFGLWIAAALTLYSGYDYFKAGMRHVVDDD